MSETRKYSRDSFSRFGDDLTGELLNYLSLNDCFEFERVAKQFQRSVFGSQRVLDTNQIDFDVLKAKLQIKMITVLKERALEIALKKCVSIDKMIVGNNYKINDRIIDIICVHGSHLRSIAFNGYMDDISAKSWQLFGETFGDSLRSISFDHYYDNGEALQSLLKLTPNLSDCKILKLNHLIFKTEQSEPVLPKLKKISAIIDANIDFKSFANMYSDRVETIILRDQCVVYNLRMREMFDELSRFRRLQVLRIEFIDLRYCDDIVSAFDSFAKNCQNLRELYLVSDSTIFSRIGHRFVSLKKLTLAAKSRFALNTLSMSDLSCCPELTELRILFSGVSLDGDHFSDIHLHLPKLKCVELNCRSFGSQFLQCLPFLKDLYYVKLTVNMVSLADIGLRTFINSSQSIRKIDLSIATNISQRTVDEFVSHAKRSEKCYNYRLRVNVLDVNVDESVGDNDMKAITSGLPKNVKILINAKRR